MRYAPPPPSGFWRLVGNLLALLVLAIAAEAVWIWLGYPPFLACWSYPFLAAALPASGFLVGCLGFILWAATGFRDTRGLGLFVLGVVLYSGADLVITSVGAACG